ncbi:MAG: UDP-glucose 4-epimerase GalE [Bacteroidota bacterium]
MSKGKILVTGGCGYIGSHTVVDLIENGFEVVSADNMHNANARVLEGIEAITGVRIQNHQIDLADPQETKKLFSQERFDGAIHFAAYKLVGESVKEPLAYFRNNLNSLLNLIEGLASQGSGNLVFSSSCSVYGNPDRLPVTEQTPRQEAESPYARTKQMGEDILQDYCRANPDFSTILLRYFNPAGAHPSVHIGEDARRVNPQLVPVLMEVAMGKREKLMVFGDDYDTRDGSAVRDYLHVMDLAHAHTLALEYLMAGKAKTNPSIFNLGIGEGLTVLEIISAFERVTGQKLNYEVAPRRDGDVVAIYADRNHASQELGWEPQYSVDDIISSAWAWEQKR